MDDRELAITAAIHELRTHPEKLIRGVARDFGLVEGTLRNRAKGKTNQRISHEFQQRLSPPQEDFLVEWVLEQDRQGHPPSHVRTRQLAIRILRLHGDTVALGRK